MVSIGIPNAFGYREGARLSGTWTKTTTDGAGAGSGRSTDALLVERSVRLGRLRGHFRAWGIGSGCLLGVGVLSWILGSGGSWVFLPIVGWGLVLALHAVTYAGWTQEHKGALAAAAESVARLPTGGILLSLPESSEWRRMWNQSLEAFAAADGALVRIGTRGIEPRGDLQRGIEHVQFLLEGQARQSAALSSIYPDTPRVDDSQITEVEWKLDRAADDKLREVVQTNLQLLRDQREKVDSLRKDMDRVRETVDGFVIASQNLRLDAVRLAASDESLGSVKELRTTLSRLSDEVGIMREVEAEMGRLEDGD